MPAPITTNPIAAIAAAWLDAERFMRCGDASTENSVRLLGYNVPSGAEAGAAAGSDKTVTIGSSRTVSPGRPVTP